MVVKDAQNFNIDNFLYTPPSPPQSDNCELLVKSVIAEAVQTNEPVDALLKSTLQSKLSSMQEHEEDAYFVADLGEIQRQYKRWCTLLPRIEPFYAVKCNPNPAVLSTLVQLGIGFDCASRNEIATMLEMGVSPKKIIYANPCKQASFIRYADQQGVEMMTFDNADELHKVKKNHPNAKLVLRILADDSRSICKLGLKFGASMDITRQLLETAKSLDLNVVGVSFHVGSGCFDSMAFREACVRARKVFDEAEEIGFQMSLLDVGGGFPSNCKSLIPFEEIASVLGPAVDEFFPPSVRVISEPGRFFVASAFTLAVNITARRTVYTQASAEGDLMIQQKPSFMYYVNDGVYGSFNCILFDHAECDAKVLCRDGVYLPGNVEQQECHFEKFKCSVWGPTCDSMDCITKNGALPELNVGDWLYYENMGAYTMCAASTFNGFKKSSIVYTNTEI